MNVVITGTSRGIGLELTRMSLAEKHQVLAIARSPDKSPGLMSLRTEYPETLQLLAVDVGQADAPKRIADAIESWPRLDIVINNAGILRDNDTWEDFLESFRINSVAPLFISRALLPKLKKSTKPKVVQITSLMGSITDNESGGSYAYRASKAALNMLNKSLAQDERWCTSIVIHPGWVKTDMGGAQAPTKVDESARGIWKVVQNVDNKDSGKFFDFEGEQLPW